MEPATEHIRKNRRFNAKVLKKAAIIGSIVLLLGFSLSAFLSSYTNKIAGLIIEELIRMRSDGAYTIQYEELDYSFLKNTLIVKNLELSVDTTSEDFIGIINTGGEVAFSARVPYMYLDITDVWAIYFKKQLKIDGVRFDNPVLNIKSYRAEEGITWQSDAGSLYNVISEHLQVFKVNDLEVKSGSFQFEKMRGALRNYSIENISFRISNFLLDSESGRGGDKFFYTDDIDIEAINQRIYLKDSIHSLYFKKLVLSTTKSEIIVDSLVVSENERTNPQNKQIDFYSIYVPSITIGNVDFKAAYNDELLNIGKLNIHLPTINVSDFPRQHSADTAKPSAAALILDYFSNIKVDSFSLKNATFGYQFLSETRKQGFSLDSLNVEMTEFRLDSSSVISQRPLYYKTLEFSVKDYQFALPDSIHIFSFTHLEGSTIRRNMTFEDLRVKPRVDADLRKLLAKNRKNKTFDMHFPKAVFYDVEGQDFFNTDTLKIRKIEVEKPRIDFTEYPSLSFERDYSDSLIFNFYPLFENFARAVYIGDGSFTEGDFSWFSRGVKLTPQYRVSHFDLRIKDIQIDSLTPKRNRLLSAENFDLFSEKVILQRESDNFLFFSDNVYYSGEQQRLNAENLEFTFFHTADGESETSDAVKVKHLQCGGVNLSQVFSNEKSKIKFLKIGQPEIKISGKAGQGKSGRDNRSIANLLGDTDIGLFSIEDGTFDIALGSNRHFSARNVYFEFNDFQSKPGNKTRFILDHYLLRLRELAYTDSLQNRLTISKLDYNPTDSTTVLNGLRFMSSGQNVQARGAQTIHVPEAVIAHWRPLNLYFYNEISPDHIELNNAEMEFVRPVQTVKKKHTKAGDMIDKISAARLMINNGKLNYRKAMENGDSLFFRSAKIDLTVHRFMIDSANVDEDIFSVENIETNLQQNQITFHRSSDSVSIGSVVKDRIGNRFDLYELLYKKHAPSGAEEMFSGRVEKMQIVGFDFEKLNEKSLEMEALHLVRPKVAYNDRLAGGQSELSELIFLENMALDSSYAKVRIDAITIDSGQVDLLLKEKRYAQPVNLSDFRVEIREFDSDNKGKILKSEDVTISFEGFRYDLPDSLNYIQTGRVTVSLSDSSLSMNGLSLTPKVDKYDYGDLKGTQTDYLKINSGILKLQGLDFEKLLIEKAVTARKFEVNDLDIYAFRDKRIPIKEEIYKPLPQELLRRLDVLLNIDTAVLHNGHIRYDEFAEDAIKPGEVEFSNLNARIANIYTDEYLVTQHPKCVVEAEALMMNEGRLSATFRFDMLSSENYFNLEATLEGMDLQSFNRILEPIAFVAVRKGRNKKLYFKVLANEDVALGSMFFEYDNLRISLISKNTYDTRGMGTSIGSFFANAFIINRNNPRLIVLREGEIYFERDKSKSIFNYWAKIFFSGVVSSIGAKSNKKEIRKYERMEDETVLEK